MIELQAELNDTVFRRGKVVKRMSNPLTWARGVNKGDEFDDFKEAMKNGNGGGFLSLAKDGDVGILQLNDVSMLDTHKKEILEDMQRIAGFSAATFGESVGANTSGDALGMYFTPTQKLIDDENIAWIAFYKSINAKILRAYATFLKPGETVTIDGYAPRGTVLPMADEPYRLEFARGAYQQQVTKEDIGQMYGSVIVMPVVTPKNEIEEKRFWQEAATGGFVSKTRAYEEIGLDSPEEDLALLEQENANPLLNPEGTSKILQGATSSVPPAAAKTPNIAPRA